MKYHLSVDEVTDVSFPLAADTTSGYRADQVDAFVDEVAARMAAGRPIDDLADVGFAIARRIGEGYRCTEVDDFLDKLFGQRDPNAPVRPFGAPESAQPWWRRLLGR